MNTYEKCKAIRSDILAIVTRVINDPDLDDEVAGKQIHEIQNLIIGRFGNVNVSDLTAQEMDELGFGFGLNKRFNTSADRMIPAWLYPFHAVSPKDLK